MPYIAGIGIVHPDNPNDLSLEELVYQASAAALEDAGMSRDDIDGVSLAASDQLDGRAISSMHLAGPAGAYLRDEVKVTDDGACALALTSLRIEAGMSSSVLTVSWTKPSASPYDAAVAVNPEPTIRRQVGLHPTVAEAMVTRRFLDAHHIDEDAFDELAAQRWEGAPPDAVLSLPLRCIHVPPPTEAAVALVVTREKAAVEVGGLAWGADHPDPTLRGDDPLGSLSRLAGQAYAEAGITPTGDLGVETTDRTVFRLAMAAVGLGLVNGSEVVEAVIGNGLPGLNTSGGLWRSNPIFAAGLERIAEAARRVRGGEPTVVAHSTYGFGGQGNCVAVLRAG